MRLPRPTDKIFLALSSGVDSSVTASILLKQHPAENLHPIYITNWTPSQHPTSTAGLLGAYGKPAPASKPAPQKCHDAEFSRVEQICKHLRLPHKPLRLSFEKEYWLDVFSPMLNAYQKGWTPNPDVSCNRSIKFGALFPKLQQLAGSEDWWVATGHYARSKDGKLWRSKDRRKDQTYFLSTIPDSCLSRCLFPLGDAGLKKSEVKEKANALAIPGWRDGETTDESFGLCFVEPAGGFRRFLGEYLDETPGDIVVGNETRLFPEGTVLMPAPGAVVGRHEGLWHATVGEKAHMQLPQGSKEFQGRWYVSRKDIDRNTIEVVKGGDNRALFSKAMVVGDWRWLGEDAERSALEAERGREIIEDGDVWERGLVTQFRHMQRPQLVTDIQVLGDGEEEGTKRVRISFKTPQKAVTLGQSAALWDGERCLGGGVIENTEGLD
ncbi:tRNA-specific 2-thiouridylase [Pyronema domesticum]|uniref:tRNA-5-taurinomethyluridine 2-sulfurtransferase n=1 Tax=Pyronema omphalodes (strain CBS 100304) TaxID=1076935 RepID=U4L9W1_PYROM|nr:tRNA-specific 2-thiouridylase [Pyronema domesticum]CCX16147.1 Similar to Mitochondrial tRNA-specific 2-thiouridylase 1; acc. no. O13947 [Pyronema omphalodes CBS 100304]